MLVAPPFHRDAAATETVPREAGIYAVYEYITGIHENQTPCRSCRSSRSDRANMPDRTDWVVTNEHAMELATLFYDASVTYNVPLATIVATARQESTFRTYAIGGAGECGMFQQTPRYIRWESRFYEDTRLPVTAWKLSDDLSVSRQVQGPYTREGITVLQGHEAICEYLMDPHNALWHFALKYHHEVGEVGINNWAAYYNSNPARMWGYQDRHWALVRDFERTLNRHVRSYARSSEILGIGICV
jgi:hypothetical protein